MKIIKGRWIGVGVGVLAVVGVGYCARPKPLVVDVAPVVRGGLETTIDADGRTRVRDRYVIIAPVSGRVARLTHVEGDLVRAGEIVARIAPLPFDSVTLVQARLRVQAAEAFALQAAAESRVATAGLAQRRRDLSRTQRLVEAGGAAPRVLEESQLATLEAEEAVLAASERYRAAEADAKTARAALAGQETVSSTALVVRAPATGRVLRIAERSERIVSAGSTLIELGDPSSLEVVIDVVSSDAALIHPGDVVRLSEWAGAALDENNHRVVGRVREIEPSGFTKVSALGVEEQRVNVIVDLDSMPGVIGDGFRVEASIVIWSAPSVTRVPRSALIQNGGGGGRIAQWTAFVARDGRAELRQVRVGHAGGADAEVLEGINEGEHVIVFPSDRLKAGVRVKSRKA